MFKNYGCLLAASLVLSLASCNNGGGETSAPESTAAILLPLNLPAAMKAETESIPAP